jgi:fucose permease
MESTGISLTTSGSLLSSQQMGAIASMIILFMFQKKIKQSSIMRIGYIIIVIGFFTITFNQHVFILFLTYTLLGFGAFLVDSGSNSFIASRYFDKRALYIPLLHFMYSAGAIVTGYIVLPFKNETWPFAYVSVAIVILTLLISQKILSEKEEKNKNRHIHQEREQGDVKVLLKDPAFILYTLVIMFYMGSQIVCSAWIPVFVEIELGQSAAITGTSLTVFWVGTAISRLIIGPILNKGAKPFSISILGMALAGISLIMATSFSTHILSVLFFTFLVGFFAGATIPMYIVVCSTWYPNNTTFISLSYIFSGTIGRMIFPFLVTYIASFFSLGFSLSLSSILLLVSAVLIMIVKKMTPSRPNYIVS